MLRKQVSDNAATYPDPLKGINLRAADEDLMPLEARLMQNTYFDGGIRVRLGSRRITATALDATKRIRGGHKFYYGGSSPANKRLVAYGTKISTVNDTGTEAVLTSGMTSDLDTYFTTWSITDKVYINNGTDTLRSYDGTTFATVAGTNIPVPRGYTVPVSDRLLAITTNGIERCNPRDPTIWSSNSSWATLRPSLVGLFTTLHPVSVRGTDSIYTGALAFQPNAWYLITGTNFGSDVTAGTASAGEDASIRLMSNAIGSSSPYGVASVPGLGVFWFTTDLNVALLPEGQLAASYVGDRLVSKCSIAGIEETNKAALGQVVMTYFDRKLWLGVPTGTNTYPSRWFWLDVRAMQTQPDLGPVWYGPHTGFTAGRLWAENQQSDFLLMGGEGNASTGAYLYRYEVPGVTTDAIGTTDTTIAPIYQTYFKAYGNPSRQKRIQGIHFDMNEFSGSATCDLLDLDGTLETGLAITAVPEE